MCSSDLVSQKDYHNYVVGTEKTVSDFITPVVFVVETMKISELLKKMQHMKTHLAVIVDEYGGTEGTVFVQFNNACYFRHHTFSAPF